MTYTYEFPRPAVTVDIVALRLDAGRLRVLLTKRTAPPFRRKPALPGGFVHANETLEDTARRVICDKAQLNGLYIEQLHTFSTLKRDPRDRIISVAYLAILAADAIEIEDERWVATADVPQLAFDHNLIVDTALQRLTAKLEYSSIGLRFLPMNFTRKDALEAYAALTDTELDKRNFNKRLSTFEEIVDTGLQTEGGKHRPAKLYTIAERDVLTY